MNRNQILEQWKESVFDLIVVGGGATGAGIALDAARRGLRVGLVERHDFASETSSRSTKLLHGGIRYLEQAFQTLSWDQFKLVREALKERSTLLKLAPHLTRTLGILTPIYSSWGVPYYTAGLKLYDRVAGRRGLGKSRFLSQQETLKRAPKIRTHGLKGSVIYYDGQFDDARMNLAIVRSAKECGALLLNYTELVGFQKASGKICGVELEDKITGERWTSPTKMVVNATGPFGDSIRRIDDPQVQNALHVSSGVHLIVDKKVCPLVDGVLIPKTEDGRVLFVLPWLGHTLIGTTDKPSQVTSNPQPEPRDIEYIKHHLEKYLEIKIEDKDILASWSGLRPLVKETGEASTSKLSREHEILVSPSRLISILGGKWTTYRSMAKGVVDLAVRVGTLPTQKGSDTENFPLFGAGEFSAQRESALIERFGLSPEAARHMWHQHGIHAEQVLTLFDSQYHKPLHPDLPYLEVDVLYAFVYEMAQNVEDVLERRTRMGFLNQKVALQVRQRVEALHEISKSLAPVNGL